MITRPCVRAGMTLIELVSAMAIFMIIVGALLVGTNTAFESWRGASARTRALGRGRAALSLIAGDLLQATAATNDFVLAASERPAWAFESDAEAPWSNEAAFDRIAAAPGALGAAPDGRVVWRVEATNNAAVLIREITYATNDTPRITEVLDGVTRLLFVAIPEDPEAEPFTEGATNALPAAIDLFLELVPPDAFRKAAGITDAGKKQSFLASQTLPLTTRVTFPHSRVPPLAASTTIVVLSGRVADAGDQGLAVDIALAGGRTNTVRSAADGTFRVAALQNARPIRVTPREPAGRAGRYTPQWLTWHPAAGSRSGVSFVWRERAVTISGTITRRGTTEPVAGVILDFPMAGQAVTERDGSYRIGVDAGWPYDGSTARVSPIHPLHPDSAFEAVGAGAAGDAHLYKAVTADESGRDYLWVPPDLVLTGGVTCADCGTPLNDIRVRAEGDGLARTDYTADRGRYRIPVPYGWSGRLTADWLWDASADPDDEETVGRFLDNHIVFNDLATSAYTAFRWQPTAVISGEVYRAVFNTNTVPVTLTRTLYSNCLDRAEIPAGLYPGRTAAISNASYTISVPHQWYHGEDARVLFVTPTNSLSGDSHGVYDPFYFVFGTPPLRGAVVDFTWVPCALSLSGAVTNSLGGPVTNQAVFVLSTCIAIAPTNAVAGIVVTNIADGVTNAFSAVVFAETGNPLRPPPLTNRADAVTLRDGKAFLFAEGPAFAEAPWVYTASNGAYTNWVSYGWSGALLPLDTNRTFTPQAVFIDNLTSNLTGVVFGSD